MSARVMLHPAMMTEMSRNLGVLVAANNNNTSSNGSGVGRVAPSRAALARVRRDLFGPVDHAANRALAERELKAQSILDAERWGFDFRLEVPRSQGHSRFDWEIVGAGDCVPEPYALRGMPYLRRQSPPTPRKHQPRPRSPRLARIGSLSPVEIQGLAAAGALLLETASAAGGNDEATATSSPTITPSMKLLQATERTPPQEARVPLIGETTPDVVPAIADLSFRSSERSKGTPAPARAQQPTTPLSVSSQTRKQAAITDFMKSRKRTLNGSTKSMIEPPEKVSRNAGQIRS